MAATYPTLANLIQINNENLAEQEFSNVLNQALAMQVIPAITASNGTQHQYQRETAAPTVGYRAVNDGIDNTIASEETVTVTLKILDCNDKVDIAVADNYRRGPEAYLERNLMKKLRQGMFVAEKQLFYGDQAPGNTAGPEGIDDVLPYLDSTGIVINAGGTTADTASSVYAVYIDEADFEEGFAFIAGNDGNFEVKETTIVPVTGSNSKLLDMYNTPAYMYTGVQIGSTYDVGVIRNLTEESGKGLTDALLGKLVSKFRNGRKPNYIFMNNRSLEQLRASRTATNPTGAEAPTPDMAFGAKIVAVESIVSTEALKTNEPT